MSSPVKSARGQPIHSRLVARAASGKLLASFLTLALAVVAGMSGPFYLRRFLSNSAANISVVSDRFLVDSPLIASTCLLDAGNRVPPKGPGLSPPRPGPYLRAVFGFRAMAPNQNTTDEGATPVDLDRQLLLYRLQRFGLIKACAQGGWRVTQRAATRLAKLQRGEAHACAEPEPVKVRPWTPRRLPRAD
jgi:hypothetical protein